MPYASVLLAILAAVLFAVSTTLQQAAARTSSVERAARGDNQSREWLPVLNILRPLLRDRAWLVGWLLNVLGFVAHAVALHFGSIATVQAILVVQLMLALMFTAARHRLRPTRRDWFATGCVSVGVASLVLLRGDVAQRDPDVARGPVVAFIAGLAVLVVLLLAVARRAGHHAQLRTALVAVGAGLCFCTTAVLVVVVTHDLSVDPVTALSWPLLGLIGSAVTGSLLVQDAFASGSLPTALTAMTITDPVASAVAGALLFDAVPPGGLELMAGLPCCGALIVTGVVLLAHSPTVHDEWRQSAVASAVVR